MDHSVESIALLISLLNAEGYIVLVGLCILTMMGHLLNVLFLVFFRSSSQWVNRFSTRVTAEFSWMMLTFTRDFVLNGTFALSLVFLLPGFFGIYQGLLTSSCVFSVFFLLSALLIRQIGDIDGDRLPSRFYGISIIAGFITFFVTTIQVFR